MELNTNFKDAFQLIKAAKNAAIVGHIRPDGDCVGCCVALRLALIGMGKSADIFIDETEGEIPHYFKYISGLEFFNKNTAPGYDLLIILDSSDESRIGKNTELRTRSKKVLCIDHHLNNQIKADTAAVNTKAASTGEILFDFFTQNEINITKEMANALFTSISSDTGCFLYPSTTAYTHAVASELMKMEIDRDTIMYYNFRVFEPQTIKALLHILKKIKFVSSGQVSVLFLDYKFIKKFKFEHDDKHKFQKYATDANGVRASIFVTETEPGEFHVSLRSHGEVNVADVALVFGGGGHKNAAGFTLQGKYDDLVSKIISEIEKAIAKVDCSK